MPAREAASASAARARGGSSTAGAHSTAEAAAGASGTTIGRPNGGSNGPRPTRPRISSTMSR
eukprot:7072896-Prymnesium_polylepis.1